MTDWILHDLPRVVVTIMGAVALGVAAALVIAKAWDRLDIWLRRLVPRRVWWRRVYSLDEHALVTLAADRAALMAEVGTAERMWSFSPAPGIDVLVIREQPRDDEGRAVVEVVRTSVRNALGATRLPERGLRPMPPVWRQRVH